MDNLLPEFNKCGDYGWKIHLPRHNSPSRHGSSPTRHWETSAGNPRARRHLPNKEIVPVRRRRRVANVRQNDSMREHGTDQRQDGEGRKLQFFRPGSVLHNKAPHIPRPATAGPARRPGAQGRDIYTDNVFLTGVPSTVEDRVAELSREYIPVHDAEAHPVRRPRPKTAGPAPGRRRRNDKSAARVPKTRTPSGTQLRLVNVQNEAATIFWGSVSGRMSVLRLPPDSIMCTSTRPGRRRPPPPERLLSRHMKQQDCMSFLLGPLNSLGRFSIASHTDDVPMRIKFSNTSIEPYNVYWIDYSGETVLRITLEPGENYIESSFVSHPWYVRRSVALENELRGREAGGGGLCVILGVLPAVSGDRINCVYHPDSVYRKVAQLSLSTLPGSGAGVRTEALSKAERHHLQADSHIDHNPFSDTGRGRHARGGVPTLRESAVQPSGLGWGDRRAGRRPASAGGNRRRAIEKLRNRSFARRRVRHSARLVRMRSKMDSMPVEVSVTICPSVQPGA